MYIGAVYVNEAPRSGGTFNTPVCIEPGRLRRAGARRASRSNLLSTAPQPFSVQGNGTADLGQSWELWLTDGDVNNPDNSGFGIPNTVDLQGTATRESDGAVFPWAATVNINQSNRGVPVQRSLAAGAESDLQAAHRRARAASRFSSSRAARSLLTIDPRGWFNLPIDFSTLPPVASDAVRARYSSSIYGDAQYCIPDTSNCRAGLGRAARGATSIRAYSRAGPRLTRSPIRPDHRTTEQERS